MGSTKVTEKKEVHANESTKVMTNSKQVEHREYWEGSLVSHELTLTEVWFYSADNVRVIKR